jgi:plastocyanin
MTGGLRASAGRWRTAAVTAALAAALGLAACGDGGSPDAERQATGRSTPTPTPKRGTAAGDAFTSLDTTDRPRTARITIAVEDFTLRPRHLTALPGQTLVFENRDDIVHRIKGTFGEPFDSGRLRRGESYEMKMKREGGEGMGWICTIHPDRMDGGVIFAG